MTEEFMNIIFIVMKSYKTVYINAVLDTARKYEQPNGKVFGCTDTCPCCQAMSVIVTDYFKCNVCPLRIGTTCINSTSYNNAISSINANNTIHSIPYNSDVPTQAMLARAKVLRQVAKVLRTLAKDRFMIIISKPLKFPELNTLLK
jgi:hypothetical protein